MMNARVRRWPTCCWTLAVLLAGIGNSIAYGQLTEKKLGGLKNDKPVVEIYLNKTPRIGVLLGSGHGVVTAQVALELTQKPDTFKAKVVGLSRLWKGDNKKDYEYRDTPFIKQVPFDDENGKTWTLLDGNSWKLGEEFTISKNDLRERVDAVPAYKSDGRNWFQKLGAVNAAQGMDIAMKVLEATSPTKK